MNAELPPDPGMAASPADFVELMNQLRIWAGKPSLRRLEKLGGVTQAASRHPVRALPASTTSYVLTGKAGPRLPRMPFVERYVASCLAACGYPTHLGNPYLRRWLSVWRTLAHDGRPGATGQAPPVSALLQPMARRQLPRDIAEFTGRTAELERVYTLAETAGRLAPTVVAIEGMAGVGKTRLAVHAAHQIVNRGLFADVQLWADLLGFDATLPAADPAAVLDTFLRRLGVPVQQIPADLEDRAALYRDRLTDARALVLLDNVASADQLRSLLPATTTCLVLITSRRGLTTTDGIQTLPLDVLHPDEAVTLLTKIAGPDRFRDDPDTAARIAARCGCLPIALATAARVLRARTAWTPAHLAARLDHHVHHNKDLHTSFALSYEKLAAEPRRLFRLLSLLPNADFSAHSAAALTGATPQDTEIWLDALLDEHLIQQTAPDWYHIHVLLRDYARERHRTDKHVTIDPSSVPSLVTRSRAR